jgi:hypothetical protein
MKAFFKENKNVTILAVVALLLVMSISVGKAMAYFTTYATAKGGVPVTLGTDTTIHEEFSDWKKTIQIENTGEVAVFVRAKVIAGSQFDISIEGTGWSRNDDGYWYYQEPVPVGGMTGSLTAAIQKSEDVESSFNIVVVQECTPVMYDKDGNPCVAENADWSMKAEYTGEEAGK